MPYYLFDWNTLRVEKLEEHGVDPEDFERAVMNPHSTSKSRSSGRPIAFGRDASGDEIACIYEIDGTGFVVSPITAYYTGN